MSWLLELAVDRDQTPRGAPTAQSSGPRCAPILMVQFLRSSAVPSGQRLACVAVTAGRSHLGLQAPIPSALTPRLRWDYDRFNQELIVLGRSGCIKE